MELFFYISVGSVGKSLQRCALMKEEKGFSKRWALKKRSPKVTVGKVSCFNFDNAL